MTAPALALINWLYDRKPVQVPGEIGHAVKYNIMVSFGSSQKGVALIKLANSFVRKSTETSNITALHLTPSNEINQFNQQEYERESFRPVKLEARKLSQPITTLFKPSQDIDDEIIRIANTGNFDLLLIGIGQSVFEGTLLGKILGFTTKIINPERLYETITGREKLFENSLFDEKIKSILRLSKVPVGIFIEKNFTKVETVFIPVFSISDSFLLVYAQKLIHNSEARVIILDAVGVIRQTPELKETIRSIEQIAPNHIALYGERKIEKEFLGQQDLMIVSIDSWRKLIESQSLWLSSTPSTLIIKP